MEKNILMIMHATSWSDKTKKAKDPIQSLIDYNDYYQIIEFTPIDKHIFNQRYLLHNGLIIKHQEVSPVPFLQYNLIDILSDLKLTDNDEIHLVGGVYNDSEGCLNMLEQCLKTSLKELSINTSFKVLEGCTY